MHSNHFTNTHKLEATAPKDHCDLTWFPKPSGESGTICDIVDWEKRKADVLNNVRLVLGDYPRHHQHETARIQAGESFIKHGVEYRKLYLEPSLGHFIPFWLLERQTPYQRYPHAVVCLHQTTHPHAIGKDEPAGLSGLPDQHYALELAQLGYAVLAPDYPSFGEYADDFQDSRFASGMIKAVWNISRVIDWLISSSAIQIKNISCMGHSLGGHTALFAGLYDQRIQNIFVSCAFTGFKSFKGGNLAGWDQPRYMPRMRTIYENDPRSVPFDFHEVIASLAPKLFAANCPEHDECFAPLSGVRGVLNTAKRIYRLHECEHLFHHYHPPCKHQFPCEVKKQMYELLDLAQ